MRVIGLVIAALLLLPAASAQAHDHGEAGPIAIVTDLGPDGLALVGHPVHFAIVAFGEDDEPDFHSDLPFRVLLDDVVLFETTAVTGHDYDGVNQFDVTFPATGTWRVEALNGGEVVAHRQGTVVTSPGEAAIDAEVSATDGTIAIDFDLQQDGRRVNHTDGWVEIYRADRLVFRTHTHTHDERQVLEYTPERPGAYEVRITGYIAFPTENGSRFAPVVYDQQVVVGVAAPSLQPATTPPLADANAVVRGASGDLELVGTYDPWTSVGPDTLQHLSAMVVSDGVPVQHVDFEARLVGPFGTVYTSDTLHEYDGIYTMAAQRALPGLYEWHVTASRGDWQDSITMPYAVTKPTPPGPLGPQLVSLAGSAEAGTPTDLTFTVGGLNGRPFAHGEIELQVRDPAGLPLLHTKLHTHGEGDFPFTYTAASAGEHTLSITPFPLESQPVAGYHGSEYGQPIASTLAVAEGPGIVSAPEVLDSSDDKESPAVPIGVALLALAFLARRR